MYKLMALISTLVRQFCLPNPFECFGDGAFLINLIAEPVIHALAFALVGLVYHRGEFPALGSFLYLLAYGAITCILAIMGIFSFAKWWVLTVVVALILIGFGLARIWRWLSGETW